MPLFANLAVGLAAAFLLKQFGGGLNLRPLQLNQVGQRKRLCGHRQNQRSSGNNSLHLKTLSGRGLHPLVICRVFRLCSILILTFVSFSESSSASAFLSIGVVE